VSPLVAAATAIRGTLSSPSDIGFDLTHLDQDLADLAAEGEA
jgi:hypothetical protein